jgi:hypothetical protein
MVVAFVTHDPRRMFSQPLWRDENWVAVTVRAPVEHVVSLTATTPVLFTALLRYVPHGSPQTLRVLPLLLTVAAVVPAWLLGREIDRDREITRIVLAVAVALAPAMLARHDLKQYTVEALDALLLCWLLARVERVPTRRRLVALAVVLGLSPLIANSAIFLVLPILGGLAIAAAVRRDRQGVRDVAVVGGLALLADLAIFLAVDSRGDTPSLRAYWDSFYIPLHQGLATAVHFVHVQAAAELQNVGLGPSFVVGGLFVAGTVVLVRSGFPVVASVVPLVALEQLAAAGAHAYPLWDGRTSTWFTLLVFVVSVVGVIGLGRLVVGAASRVTGRRHAASVTVGVAAAVGLAALLAVPLVRADRTAVDTTTPPEDVPGQLAVIDQLWHPGDVILANVDAGFGLAVYGPSQPEFLTSGARLNTFRIAYPPRDRIVVARTISTAAEIAASRQAVAMARGRPGARVWLVLSHWHTDERRTMQDTLARSGTLSTPEGPGGPEAVQLLTLGPPSTPPVVPAQPTVG